MNDQIRRILRSELEAFRDENTESHNRVVLNELQAMRSEQRDQGEELRHQGRVQQEHAKAINDLSDRIFKDNGRPSFASRIRALEIRFEDMVKSLERLLAGKKPRREAQTVNIPPSFWKALTAVLTALVTWLATH